MVEKMNASVLPALTPYVLIMGAFTLVFFKVFKVNSLITRFYVSLYLVFSFIASLLIYNLVENQGVVYYTIGGFQPPIGITYVVDGFSGLIGLVISGLALFLYLLFSIFPRGVDEYYLALYLGLVAGLLGVIYTGDLFNMFVMLEVALISSYGLIALGSHKESYKAVFDYIMIAGVGGILFFLGVGLIYFAAGTVNIGQLGLIQLGIDTGYRGLVENPGRYLPILAIILFWSLAIDEALAPLHFWLPPAYSSINPVTASLLAGVAEGVSYYALARIIYTVLGGLTPVLEYSLRILGILTILVGGLGAVYSKRILYTIAYTVVMDSGYIAIALSLGPSGLGIALLYIIAHAIVKPLLFLTAGWIRETHGTDKLDSATGSLRASRILQLSMVIGAITIAGIPPTIFFTAKLQVYMGLLEAISRDYTIPVALVVAFIGSAMGLVAFLKILNYTVFEASGIKQDIHVPGLLKIYLLVLSIVIVLLGLIYGFVLDPLISSTARSLIDERSVYLEVVRRILWIGD